MKKLLSVLVLTLLVTNCITDTSAQDTSSTNILPTSTTVSPTTAPPATTTASPTTEPPATTTAPPATTTVSPTTAPPATTTASPTTEPPATTTASPTTEPPATTTVSPTTAPPATTTVETTTSSEPTTTPKTSTTNLPTTSSAAPPTTQAPPTPEKGLWNVTSENGTICIRAILKAYFHSPEFGFITLFPNASSDGSTCEGPGGTQELVLTDNSTYVLGFIFEKDSSSVFVRNITFNYNLLGFTGSVTNNTQLFKVKSGNSYLCTASTNVIFENVTMEISEIHIQAFGEKDNKDFSTAEECEADNPVNDIVPIAVGVALLALVVVVLIAYLVGRRRSRQKGYQSM